MASPRGTNEVERLADLVGPAVRVGDRLCLRSFQSAVGCADLARGAVLWSRNAGGANAVGADAETVFGADASDRISAWRANSGDLAWTNERLLYRSLSAPLSVGRAVVFGDLEGQLHFLSREDGRSLLRLPTDGSQVAAQPVKLADTVLVVTRKGGVFAFRAE
jgi:outer membrane protein assembly factor BamB